MRRWRPCFAALSHSVALPGLRLRARRPESRKNQLASVPINREPHFPPIIDIEKLESLSAHKTPLSSVRESASPRPSSATSNAIPNSAVTYVPGYHSSTSAAGSMGTNSLGRGPDHPYASATVIAISFASSDPESEFVITKTPSSLSMCAMNVERHSELAPRSKA